VAKKKFYRYYCCKDIEAVAVGIIYLNI